MAEDDMEDAFLVTLGMVVVAAITWFATQRWHI